MSCAPIALIQGPHENPTILLRNVPFKGVARRYGPYVSLEVARTEFARRYPGVRLIHASDTATSIEPGHPGLVALDPRF